MKQLRKTIYMFGMIALIGVLLMACSNNSGGGKGALETNNAQTAQSSAQPTLAQNTADPKETVATTTRKYTDYKGHQVEIPVKPERIVFWGETLGDLIVLDVDPVGTGYDFLKGTLFEDQLKNTEDVGFPINLEKTLELQPDLIITGSTDEKEFEQLSKVASTVMFDTFAPLKDRMPLIGDLLGKKQEAEAWLAKYNSKAEDMWKQLLANGVKPNETATVLTFYPGDRLFVMAITGLSQVLYDPNGFKPTDLIQDVLDANKGFQQISIELLEKYAGDRIFVLNAVPEEAQKSTEELMKSRIWKDLPAVKKGHVYSIDILKSGSDAYTRDWLLNELPKMMTK